MTNPSNFWLAISVIFLVVLAVLWVLKRIKLRRARTRPAERDRVDSAVLRLESRSPQQSAWVAEVNYSYAVRGTSCSGRLRRQFMRKKSAEKWIGSYRSDLPLTPRYNPAKPRDSVLFDNDQGEKGAIIE